MRKLSPEQVARKLAYDKAYRAANREKINARTNDSNRRRRLAFPAAYREAKNRWYRDLRAKVLEKFGGECAICGFDDPRCLQIDHVHGGGTRERKTINGEQLLRKVLADEGGMYQLLCANCNWLKRWEARHSTERSGPKSGISVRQVSSA